MQLLPNGKQTFFDGAGNPLANGKVYFYLPNTSTPATTYQDASGNTANPNPVVLDGNGQAIIYGTGSYRQVVEDANGVTVWDQTTTAPDAGFIDLGNSTNGKGADLVANAAKKVASIAALRALRVPQGSDAQTVFVNGQIEPIVWNATSTAMDDGGITFMPNSLTSGQAGCWVREFSGTVNVKWFGAKIDGVTDDAPAVRSAMSALSARGGGTLFFPDGTCYLASLTSDAAPYQCFADIPANVSIVGNKWRSILKAAPGLSTSNQWSFFVQNLSTDVKRTAVRDLVFDFNGANNLTPSGSPYRPCFGVGILREGAAVFDSIEISGCVFLNNPGSNSISIVDNNPSGGVNQVRMVDIHDNYFIDFGYPVNNNANTYQTDHSCIYVQAQEVNVHHNFAHQNYTIPEGVSGIGNTFLDLHAGAANVSDNITYNLHTLIAHQPSTYNAYDTRIAGNICQNVDRLYCLFDGSGNVENLSILDNVVSPPFSSRALPCIDFYDAITYTIAYNVDIRGNAIDYRNGTATGKSYPAIRFKTGDNINIESNTIQNAPGDGIDLPLTKGGNRLFIKNNVINSYGAGGQTGYMRGINIDTTAIAANQLQVYIRNNVIHKGAQTTREAGLYFNGPFDELYFKDNDVIGAASICTTPSFNVTSYDIQRGQQQVTIFLNFAAPVAIPGQVSQTVTVNGAKLGDIARISAPIAIPANFILSAAVTAANTVTVTWTQIAGTAVDPDGSGAYYRVVVDQTNTD